MATSPVQQPERKRRRIVLPGGSGNIGELLAKHFHERGDDVVVLSRRPRAAPWTVLLWDGQTEGAWVDTVDGADAVIHLSGRTVNTRSTVKHRQEIYDSRIVPTRLLNKVIRGLRHPPSVWLNASTATIYKHALDEPQEESDYEVGGYEPDVPKAWAFSVKVGLDWEAALDANAMPHTRRVALRTSLVMSPQPGSVFAVLSRLARLGLGGTQGRGTQRVSWIHAADYVRAIDRVLENPKYNDIVNLSAPDAPVNRDFMRVLREAWDVHFGLPTPEWMIQIGTFLMRTEPELVLKSRWVYPGWLEHDGFQFDFPTWQSAAKDLVQQMRSN